MLELVCKQCGGRFLTRKCGIKQGRGKFCSRKCYILDWNSRIPGWNKGKSSTWAIGNKWRNGKTNKNPHKMFSSDNHNWKGNKVSYRGLHLWVERRLGKPMICKFCGDKTQKHYHWANKSKNYLRDITDWIRLCPKCHKKFDR